MVVEFMKADIVCEGGGVKGIALLGAIYYLEEKGYTFQNFAGTSAGAIVSSLLAVGYTGKELKELLLNIKFTDFYEKNKLCKRYIGCIIREFYGGSVCCFFCFTK